MRRLGKISGIIVLLLAAVLVLLTGAIAFARDPGGRYAQANPELHQWMEGLASRKGPCCSDADGAKVDDPDWTNDSGHYRVKVDGIWFDVPDEAVITEPNKAGFTMVWPLYYWQDGQIDHSRPPFGIRCFLPGAQS